MNKIISTDDKVFVIREYCDEEEYNSYDVGDKYPKEEEDEQETD